MSSQTSIKKISLVKSVLERNSLPKLENVESLQELHIDFSENFMLNSLGIQDWIMWLSPIARKPGVKIFLHKCPVSVVQQINLVVNFLPTNAEVMSFYAPFYNDNSDESRLVLLVKDKDYSDGNITLPEVRDSKGKAMELDVTPKIYFRFLGVDL